MSPMEFGIIKTIGTANSTQRDPNFLKRTSKRVGGVSNTRWGSLKEERWHFEDVDGRVGARYYFLPLSFPFMRAVQRLG